MRDGSPVAWRLPITCDEPARRHAEEDVVRAREAGGHRLHAQLARELDLGQVGLVLAVGLEPLGLLGRARLQRGAKAAAGEQDGHGGPERAGAEHDGAARAGRGQGQLGPRWHRGTLPRRCAGRYGVARCRISTQRRGVARPTAPSIAGRRVAEAVLVEPAHDRAALGQHERLHAPVARVRRGARRGPRPRAGRRCRSRWSCRTCSACASSLIVVGSSGFRCMIANACCGASPNSCATLSIRPRCSRRGPEHRASTPAACADDSCDLCHRSKYHIDLKY